MMDYHGLELKSIKEQMANLCSFSLGRERILELEPSFNFLVIRQENKRIKEALSATIHYGSMPFYGIKDYRVEIESAKKGRVLNPTECVSIGKLIQGVGAILAYSNKFEEEREEISDLVESLVFHQSLKKEIENTFDSDGTVLDTASPALKEIRHQLNRLEQEIQKTTTQFLQKNKEYLAEQIITTRNDRVVALVKVSEKNRFGGFLHGESASGQTSYVEPSSFVDFNNRKQTLINKEKDEIELILLKISQLIQECADQLLGNLETASILDALFAKAQWGKNQEATVATLVSSKEVVLKKARHPLISYKEAVLNTYRIIPPISVLLITGANTGGKTVSLKTIGLAVLMTYCGMPICCEEAEIPFFDQVFIDIGDDQSIVQSLSTFSAHLSKLATITNQASSASLILLDELGSGTDPKEGESLAIAILDELRKRQSTVVATTHYGKLKAYGTKHEDILLASVQFDLEKLKPTYQYIEGLTGQSNAFDIAKRFGLSDEIIEKARQLKEKEKSQEDQLIEQLEKQSAENEILQAKLNHSILKSQAEEQEFLALKEAVAKERETIKRVAQEEAEYFVQVAKEESQRIIEELKTMQQEVKYHELLKVKEKLNDLTEITEEPLEEVEFKKGDFVELIQSNQIAQIVEIKKSRITIELNGKLVHTKVESVRPTHRKIDKKKQTFQVRTSKIGDFKSECNVLGLRVEEALQEVSKHIDDAQFHNYPQVRLVHGDGSGALRSAIHDWLRKNKSVDSFRLGMPREGSTGVTIVTLKGGK